MPNIQVTREIDIAADFLLIEPSSEINATPGSSNYIDELNAATDKSIKNNGPTIWP